MRRLALLIALSSLVALATGCTKPSVLVCESVSQAGHCVNPVTQLDVGREYTVYATGFGLPHGNPRFRVLEKGGGGYAPLAEASRHVPDEAEYVTNPLRLVTRGHFRVELVGEDGSQFDSVDFRVTGAQFAPTRLTP